MESATSRTAVANSTMMNANASGELSCIGGADQREIERESMEMMQMEEGLSANGLLLEDMEKLCNDGAELDSEYDSEYGDNNEEEDVGALLVNEDMNINAPIDDRDIAKVTDEIYNGSVPDENDIGGYGQAC